jgi:hypothetical protein
MTPLRISLRFLTTSELDFLRIVEVRKHLHTFLYAVLARNRTGASPPGTNKARHAAKIRCCVEKIAMRFGDGSGGQYVKTVPFVYKKRLFCILLDVEQSLFCRYYFVKTVVQLHLSVGGLA